MRSAIRLTTAAAVALALSATGPVRAGAVADGGTPTWIVTLDTPPLRARAPAADRAAARQALIAEQAALKARIAAAIGGLPPVSHHYLSIRNAIAVQASAEQAARIATVAGVASVRPETRYAAATDAAPAFVGADRIWDGSAVPDGIGTRGEGSRIGVIDTGLNLSGHPSFADDPACGHGGAQPHKLLSALDCMQSDSDGLCDGPDAGDTANHGAHVAAIAAGNALDAAAVPAPARPIAGIAPCASLRTYRVCIGLTCPESAVLAAQESVLLHGDLDVVNFSVTGGTSPWQDVDAGFLDLVEDGVFVAAAAGNIGGSISDPVGRVNHLGPWILTVAAVSHHGDPDVLAGFSLRGPTPAAFDRLTKPDLAGTGVAVYAAAAAGIAGGYAVLDGTSMASPSVTGAAALLRRLHPDWTPMALKSALQTTAVRIGRSDDGITPWHADEVGHGRLDAAAAARAALVLDETPQRLRAADPALAALDLRALNLASLRDLDCQAECVFTRTVRSVADVPLGWQAVVAPPPHFDLRVEPAAFVLDPGAEQTLRIVATERLGLPGAAIGHGSIALEPVLTDRPTQVLTVALRGDGRRVRIFHSGFEPTLVATGPLDHPVAQTEAGTSLRLVAGAARDGALQPGDDLNLHVPAGSGALAIRWPAGAPRNAAIAVNSYSSRYRVLQSGDAIGPGAVYSRVAGSLSEWQAGAEGYLGVRVDCADVLDDPPAAGLCYGYVHLRTGPAAGLPATVLDMAVDVSGQAVVIP